MWLILFQLLSHLIARTSFAATVENIEAIKLAISAKTTSDTALHISDTKRSLVLVHVGIMSAENSMDVMVNNIKMFSAAVSYHSTTAAQQAFYVFNVVGGFDNPLYRFLPPQGANVAIQHWEATTSDMKSHMRTTTMLGADILTQFGSVVFLNQYARGPFVGRKDGKWLSAFQDLLNRPEIALVGPTISCEVAPHVHTHMFALKSSLVIPLFQEIAPGPASPDASWLGLVEKLEVGLSTLVQQKGHKIASLLHQHRTGNAVFNGTCLQGRGNAIESNSNPTTWCDLKPSEVEFMEWGGEPLRIPGYCCEDTVNAVTASTIEIAAQEPVLSLGNSTRTGMKLILPETVLGGPLYDLYKQYAQEVWKDRSVKTIPPPELSKRKSQNSAFLRGLQTGVHSLVDLVDEGDQTEANVCFLIRTASMHDASPENKALSNLLNMDLETLVQSLLRQSNPHWKAFFFLTDNVPFDKQLDSYLRQHNDVRLMFLPIDSLHRPKFTRRDAGYTATDHVLKMLSTRQECQWLSVTNADNAYGSEVVNQVFNTPMDSFSGTAPSMVLSPLDSRNFAEQDYLFRDALRGEMDQWQERCVGMEAMHRVNTLGYTVQPLPIAGKVDLAGLFLNRARFAAENIFFGNFSDTRQYPCIGCQDGYLTEYLVRFRQWSYVRLPIDGMKSIIFHGPSPTWCIASGNVWFDYPEVNKVGCLSHKTVGQLHSSDYYDWNRYYGRDSPRICLRLTGKGHANKSAAIIK